MKKFNKISTSLNEEIIESEYIFRGKFLNIIRDKVKTPTEQISYREYVDHPGAALIIPEIRPGRVLLVQQYRHAVQSSMWEFPAGKRDKGEQTITTAHRELLEETGYEANKWQELTFIHPVIGYANERIDIFLAQDLVFKGAKPDHDEAFIYQEFELDELLKMLKESKLSDVKTQIAVFWYQMHLEGKISTSPNIKD